MLHPETYLKRGRMAISYLGQQIAAYYSIFFLCSSVIGDFSLCYYLKVGDYVVLTYYIIYIIYIFIHSINSIMSSTVISGLIRRGQNFDWPLHK